MSDVVNFTAFLNDRRATAENEKRDAARMEREKQELEKAVAPFASRPAAAAIVSTIVQEVQAEKRRAADNRPMPAYCDPANERRGSKYDATKSLSRVEIAARIRADIKDELKAGRLPAGLKVSVRTESYSGGGSIDVRVTALPSDFVLLAARYVEYAKQNPDDYRFGRMPFAHADRFSPSYVDLMDKLKAIHSAYNRDNSDSMTDYFDVKYYGSVSLDWQLRQSLECAEGLPV